MVVESFLDALGGGGADALVDRQCLPQVGRSLARVAVLQSGAVVARFTREACPPATELWRYF